MTPVNTTVSPGESEFIGVGTARRENVAPLSRRVSVIIDPASKP